MFVSNFEPTNEIKGINDLIKQNVKSIKFSLNRNLDNYPLLTTVNKAERIEIIHKIKQALDDLSDPVFKGSYYYLNLVTKSDSDNLRNDMTMFEKGNKQDEMAGLNKGWPYMRGLFYSDDKSVVAQINKND